MDKSKITIICLFVILTIIIILTVIYCAINYISFDNSTETSADNSANNSTDNSANNSTDNSANNSATIYYDGKYYIIN